MQINRNNEPQGCTFTLLSGQGVLVASCQVIGQTTIYFDGMRMHPERTHADPRTAVRVAGLALVDRACREIARNWRAAA